jgi:hypothetical protein
MNDPVQQSTALAAQAAFSLFDEARHRGLSECPDSEPERPCADAAVLLFLRQSA